jgi:hypothetical protein
MSEEDKLTDEEYVNNTLADIGRCGHPFLGDGTFADADADDEGDYRKDKWMTDISEDEFSERFGIDQETQGRGPPTGIPGNSS